MQPPDTPPPAKKSKLSLKKRKSSVFETENKDVGDSPSGSNGASAHASGGASVDASGGTSARASAIAIASDQNTATVNSNEEPRGEKEKNPVQSQQEHSGDQTLQALQVSIP